MKIFLPASLFSLTSLILIFSWFREGFIYGGGDVGIQEYNPQRILEIIKYVWWEASAPGVPIPQGLTALPFNFLFSFLQFLGFGPVALQATLLQATLFFLILFLMGFGMYLLILSILPNRKSFAVLGAFFYMFNPYMMISVWHRFVHTTFFMMAALPFLAIFWQKWIKRGSQVALLLFLLTNLFAVYLFGTIAFIVTVWLFLALLAFSEVFFPWQGRKVILKTLGRFFLGLALWFLTNVWWLYPTFTIAPVQLGQQHTAEESTVTLINLARQTITPYLLQMVNPFYLIFQKDFGQFYLSFMGRLLPWVFIIPVIIGFLYGLKNKRWAFWSILFLIILFLSKGAASPFGHGFIWAFQNFFPLGVLRNPYEKIGVLLPFFASIVFVFGLIFIFDYLKNNFGKKLGMFAVLAIFISLLIFAHPMFSGLVLGTIDKKNFVQVPGSYILADDWIKKDIIRAGEDTGKILHLPLTRGESITYNWEQGYSGLEPSPLFFTSAPSISHGFNLKRMDDSLTALSMAFAKGTLPPETILRLLQDFNIRFIVLHKDVKWQGSDLYDPQKTEVILDNLDFLQKQKDFGELIIYKLQDSFRPKIEVFENPILVYPHDNLMLNPWLASQNGLMISQIAQTDDLWLLERSIQLLIFAKKNFEYLNQNNLDILKAETANLEKLIPILEFNGEIAAKDQALNILKASGILQSIKSKEDLNQYNNIVKQIFINDLDASRLLLYVKKISLAKIFEYHLSILQDPESKELLRQTLIKNNLLPIFEIKDQKLGDFGRYFHFYIPKEGEYEILMENGASKNIYPGELNNLTLQINSEIFQLPLKDDNSFLSSGKLKLTKGDYEISYNQLFSNNLITADNSFTISGETNHYVDTNALPLYGKDVYRVSFEAQLLVGRGFNFQILADNYPTLSQFVNLPSGQSVMFSFLTPVLQPTTKEVNLRFLVDSSSNVAITNLKVERVLNNEVLLRGDLADKPFLGQKVDFERQSPILYKGKVKIDDPAFLVFKETFHPGWELKLTKDNKIYKVDKHLMANLYANAYFLENPGEYDFTLEFKPQRMVYIGTALAVLTYIGIGVIIAISWYTFSFSKSSGIPPKSS